KLLRAELASSPEAAERFVRESRASSQIDHANLIDIFNFGRLPNGRHFLVMDYVAGSSLRARVSQGPLPHGEAIAILGTIADALDAAHARGVVHRDLKPDNVMLSADDPPKVFVLDFGIAKLVSAAEIANGMSGNGTLTGQGTWLGTPGYMAPEQWSSDGAGPASDRYAFGVMAFELFAGKLPFAAANLPAMMEQHFRAPVPALSTRRGRADQLLDALDPIFARAMAKDPDARFPSGRAMVDALREAVAVGAPPVKLARPAASKKPWIPAAIGAGVLGMSVLGVIAVRGGKTGEASSADPAEPAATAPDRPVPGTIEMIVISTPPGAEIVEGGSTLGPAPRRLHPRPGTRLTIVAKKPGYEPSTIEVTAPGMGAAETARTIAVSLLPITGFEGVWRLENGELRELRRAGDRVDIFKRAAVTGPREPYRSYDVVADDDGLAFAGSEDVKGMGDKHRCLIQHKIVYHYDPKADRLDVQREHVGSKVEADGQCVIVSRAPGDRVALVRVDAVGDVHYTDAPVGRPPVLPSKLPNDTFDNAIDVPQKSPLDAGAKDNSSTKGIPPTLTPTPIAKPTAKIKPVKPLPVKNTANEPIQQRLPEPQAQAPSPDLEPAPQQQPANQKK
ncbi:MAG: protein kinase, partial [Proteobacteria bacterium]|nr:protein kinase [Pseudomonadota bacterium]